MQETKTVKSIRAGFFIIGIAILMIALLFLLDVLKGQKIALLVLIYCTAAWFIIGITIAVVNIISIKKNRTRKNKILGGVIEK